MSDSRMSCDEFVSEGTSRRYVAGTLSDVEMATFEAHLLVCDRCQEDVLLAAGVREAIRIDERRPGNGRSIRPRMAAIAAMAASIAVAGWWAWSSVVGTTAAERRLVVMPFGNLTADSTNDYVLAGLYDGLLSELKQIGALTVLSRETAEVVASREEPLPAIADELQANLFLQASVSSVGDSLSLELRLHDAATERVVWRREYRAPADSAIELSALPRSIVRALAEEGTITLTPAERRRLDREHRVDPAARRLYNEGLFFLKRFDADAVERGVRLLERATVVDPAYAEAHALLSTAYISAVYSIPLAPSDAYPAAKQAARTAIALDETIGEAYASLGWSLFMYDWDWEAALRALERGFELEPENERAAFYYSFVLSLMGRHADAIRLADAAMEVDPLSIPVVNHVGTVRYFARDYEGAIAGFNRALQLQPDFGGALQWLPLAYSQLGRHEAAITAGERAVEANPLFQGILGIVLARAGRTVEAAEIADRLHAEVGRGAYSRATNLAALYAALGERNRAFELLERALELRDGSLQILHESPEFDALRSDPRFQRLQRRLGKLPDR